MSQFYFLFRRKENKNRPGRDTRIKGSPGMFRTHGFTQSRNICPINDILVIGKGYFALEP